MSLSAHLQGLKNKHEALSGQIEELEKDESFDSINVSNLKGQKPRLKEEIRRLTELSGTTSVTAE